jgi:hypothetical protein
MPKPVTVEHNARRGRPRKQINLEFLQDVMDSKRNISISKLAKAVGVHRNTLRYYLKFHDVDTKFSSISDKNLDLLIKTFQHTKPDSGIRYLVGFLRRHGLKVQRERVRASIKRVDRLGQTIRHHQTAKARRNHYYVSRPNALWHIDGHHKMILWGIVIHGCIDGYSRTVRIVSTNTTFNINHLNWSE